MAIPTTAEGEKNIGAATGFPKMVVEISMGKEVGFAQTRGRKIPKFG